ncbi:putative enzyme related to lactoylglutathione lyase [Methanohalophilus levihalophilus]|uniref:VOC family protein n=1 Tax=Methanohalophilus levihalophilus TaxID=1431282 RepID=UPI001AE76C27|nr:VOC family protein [Methanohalophilus levihalophilus]MBP2029261.1 putative enzyme related to lactoylglutathione lyase [Methanohalophilus levihalophilus]
MDPVAHFEIPAKNKEKMKEFYGNVFDWQFQDLPEMNYTMIYTTEIDEQFMPKEVGSINGGMATEDPAESPVLVIVVQNMQESLNKAKDAGAEMVMEPVDIPGVGSYARINDIEGNLIGIMEPAMK